MPRIKLLTTLVVLSLVCPLAIAKDEKGEEKKVTIKVGQPAPDFTLKDHSGKDVKLSDLWKKKKKNVLIAFYPKDFTGG